MCRTDLLLELCLRNYYVGSKNKTNKQTNMKKKKRKRKKKGL